MGQSGKKLTLNSNQPKYGTKQLVSSEQAKEVRRRKITFSFSYFKQIPNFDEILDNEEEFPMMQFSISKSTGRIVGYFDRDPYIFHVVLLDPNHNIQPAKKTNYQIQPTTKGISQYDELLNKMERIKKIVANCPDKNCKLHAHITTIEELHENIVYIGLDGDFYSTYQGILQDHSLQEILEQGIWELMKDDGKII